MNFDQLKKDWQKGSAAKQEAPQEKLPGQRNPAIHTISELPEDARKSLEDARQKIAEQQRRQKEEEQKRRERHYARIMDPEEMSEADKAVLDAIRRNDQAAIEALRRKILGK